MGLDCPDVCQILHWDASNDIESYTQETGRCGRDGFSSNAVMLYFKMDERFMSLKGKIVSSYLVTVALV